MIKLELTVQEVDAILAGLQELPFKFSHTLIFKIKDMADKQMSELKVVPKQKMD